jgi:hypothetical protein
VAGSLTVSLILVAPPEVRSREEKFIRELSEFRRNRERQASNIEHRTGEGRERTLSESLDDAVRRGGDPPSLREHDGAASEDDPAAD